MNSMISKYKRHISFFFLLTFVTNVFFPTATWALTSGATQPEVHNFQPINVADMVDPATGDFSYNIPLLDVDGYPINISYKSGVSMEQEASNVGLGWTLNVGSVNRNLRGIPDDFDGEEIVKKMNIKENESAGVTIAVGGEFAGVDPVQMSYAQTITYNTYTGYGFTQKTGFSLSLGSSVGVGLGIASSADGLTISPNISLSASLKDFDGGALKGSVSLGTSYNSRVGIREMSLSAGLSISTENGSSTHDGIGKDADGNLVPTEWTNHHGSSSQLASTHSNIMFGSPSYVPQINMPTHTQSFFGSTKLGGTVFAIDVDISAAVNWSKETLAESEISSRAYGYLNLQNGQQATDAILDFNREKDGHFSEATTNLPIPNLTYDNFIVAGQGVGGSYRAHRSDIGYVYDVMATNSSDSKSATVEVAVGNACSFGTDITLTSVNGFSGVWVDQNSAMPDFGFTSSGNTGYEPAYFKEMGEMSVDEDNLYNHFKKEQAVRYELNDLGAEVGINNKLIAEDGNDFTLNSVNKRTKRAKRNQLFSYLTLDQAKDYGLQQYLYKTVSGQPAPLISGNAKSNHIAEITTTKTDGSRYVYGLPAYNNQQLEVSFSMDGLATTSDQLITYTPGTDDSRGNKRGWNNYFSSTELPAYAYGYMITAVLSADYVDKTGNGPTKDDLGSYTLFNYKKHQSNYQWRAPLSGPANAANMANHDEGLMTDLNDDRASYLYGTKEIYYIDNIVTKNHIALFNYSSRRDAHGANGTVGGISTSDSQLKLDDITLYSLPDYELKLANAGYQPFVLKQAHFKYNYELCNNVYNNDGLQIELDNSGNDVNVNKGKLTLKEIYFTYGKSNKGKLSPYKFNYNNKVNSANVNYTPSSIDRWGEYKPSDPTLPNSKYPYTERDKTLEDQYVKLWNLKSIQLPSGGLLEVELESDDYAYVQDKRACEMVKIAGIGQYNVFSPATDYSSYLNHGTLIDPLNPGNQIVLLFELKDQSNPTPDVVTDYFSEIDKLYFNFKVNVLCSSVGSNIDEYVHGYCDIDKGHCGSFTSGGVKYGYIKLKTVRRGDKLNLSTPENPISKAAWQFARLYRPKEAYSCHSSANPASGQLDPMGLLTAIADADFMKNTIQFYQGANGALKALGIGSNCDYSKSWIRLNSPDKIKLGGGSRVKQVTIRDQWDKMITNATAQNQGYQYGQMYDYTMQEDGKTVSSGVAAYEPSFGADENPFRQPVYMDMHKEEALLAPDHDMYVEEPMGESFFPPPTIVYSRVTTSNLVSGAGKTVNEFYTSRDFPTIVHSLGLDAKRKKPDPIFKLFSFVAYDRFTGSQGYSIEVNDMHGKMKAVHLYEEGATVASKSNKYYYKTSGNQLTNTVKTVSKSGLITDSRIGVDYDFYADFRQSKSTTEAEGLNMNLALFFASAFPIIIPVMLPTYHKEEIELRTAVTNKVIYKYGVLDRVETTDNSNTMVSQNLLWDAETGKVLLTGTNTEFKDPIYTLTYPSHWAYEGTGGGYKNIGLEINSPHNYVLTTGQISNVVYNQLLQPGDELALYTSSGPKKGWVETIGSHNYIIKPNGVVYTKAMLQSDVSKVKVIRSGRRNLLDMNVGAITTFTNPLYNNPNAWPSFNQSYAVLNASAIELGSRWGSYCGCDNNPTAGNAYNGYLQGTKGNYRVVKSYTYLTTRNQEKVNNNTNIRTDGTFRSFTPFFTPAGINDWNKNATDWQWAAESTKSNPYGLELENKDPLNRYTSALYGYQQTLPVAATSNSRFNQMANESFEYNDLNFCADDHFGFNQYSSKTYLPTSPTQITKIQKFSHTGKRSIKVSPGGANPIMITKQLTPCQ